MVNIYRVNESKSKNEQMKFNLFFFFLPERHAGTITAGLNCGQFCLSGDIWQFLETFLIVTDSGVGRVLLASTGWKPGMLLNMLQCLGQPCTTNGET